MLAFTSSTYYSCALTAFAAFMGVLEPFEEDITVKMTGEEEVVEVEVTELVTDSGNDRKRKRAICYFAADEETEVEYESDSGDDSESDDSQETEVESMSDSQEESKSVDNAKRCSYCGNAEHSLADHQAWLVVEAQEESDRLWAQFGAAACEAEVTGEDMFDILCTTEGGSELQDALLKEASNVAAADDVVTLEEVAVSKKVNTFREEISQIARRRLSSRGAKSAAETEVEVILINAASARLKGMYLAEKAEVAAEAAAKLEATQKIWSMLAQAAMSKRCIKPTARRLPQELMDEIIFQDAKVNMDARRDARRSTINGFRKTVLLELKEVLPKWVQKQEESEGQRVQMRHAITALKPLFEPYKPEPEPKPVEVEERDRKEPTAAMKELKATMDAKYAEMEARGLRRPVKKEKKVVKVKSEFEHLKARWTFMLEEDRARYRVVLEEEIWQKDVLTRLRCLDHNGFKVVAMVTGYSESLGTKECEDIEEDHGDQEIPASGE
ncbi:hypothetical protein YB2330_003631 [Saitoella coloradoensis]